MGIYLYGAAAPRGHRGFGGWLKSLLGSRPDLHALRGELVRAIGVACRDDWVLARCFHWNESEGVVGVRLFPASEWLELRVEDGRIQASARTSTLGPGYHAALVDLLERAGQARGLEWDWSEDESEYGVHRDFAKLQATMAGQLRSIAGALCTDGHVLSAQNICVNWGAGLPQPADNPGIVTPMGVRSHGWAERLHAGSEPDVEDAYPWWTRDRGPREWAKLAAIVLWPTFPWRLPASDDERLDLELAVEACRRAGPEQLERVGIGHEEVRELDEIAAGRTPSPRPQGYGLRRRPLRWTYGAWTVVFPGDAVQDEGTLAADGLSVYVGVMTVRSKPNSDGLGRHTILRLLERDGPAELVEASSEHVLRIVRKETAEDGAPRLQGAALTATPDGMLAEVAVVTITYPSAADEPRAVEVLRSLTRAPITSG